MNKNSSLKKISIIGHGSIAKKHITFLEEQGIEVSICSRRVLDLPQRSFLSLEKMVNEIDPDVIWICNETSAHEDSLEILDKIGYQKIVLVEKPISHQRITTDFSTLRVYVTYNLRTHPLLEKLKEELKNQKIIALNAYVGQYLPSWRPGSDYRNSYSADINKGGGVLRDLSHELDYVLWLTGMPTRLVAAGGKLSSLEVSSDDYYSIMLGGDNYPNVNIILNYLDRVAQRYLVLHTNDCTYKIDFIAGKLFKNDTVLMANSKMSDSYINQIAAIKNENWDKFCSYERGNSILHFISLIEESAKKCSWVNI